MGSFLALVGLSFIGPIVTPFFPPLATEATAMYYGGDLRMNPWLVGLACTIGQNACFIVLYFAGAGLVGRWAWLHRQIDWIRVKYTGARRAFLLAMTAAMFFGVPPVLPLAIVARGFGMSLPTLVLIGIPLRFFRFTVFGAVGAAIWPWVLSVWARVVELSGRAWDSLF